MMKRRPSLPALALLGTAAFTSQALAQNTVTAIKAANAPDLAASAADPAWAKAQALTVPLLGGKNFKDGNTTATIKAVYADDRQRGELDGGWWAQLPPLPSRIAGRLQ